jgi:transcriptional regulator with PAS, ATPase and Fis domain
MGKLLLSWIGLTDLRASQGLAGAELGPIFCAVKARGFQNIVLLSDHAEETTDQYVHWLMEKAGVKPAVRPIKLTDAMDFGKVYRHARRAVAEVLNNEGKNSELVFAISPGTPAMAATWIFLGKTFFPQAELIESSRQKKETGEYLVRTVSVPFDITAEPILDLLERQDQRLANLLQGLPAASPEFDAICHHCTAMKRVITKARLVAPRNVPVILLGESGTGKELMANAIHKSSPRSGPFIPVNCGAIPANLVESELFGTVPGAFTHATNRAGHFETADGGTLFLDEIGELSLDVQVKLLRVIQESQIQRVGDTKLRTVNVRIIAATHRDLSMEVAEGRFRADLFYRLAVGVIHLPPLREREGELQILIDHILTRINTEFAGQLNFKAKTLSPAARNVLAGYDWPGNIRELENTLMRASTWTAGSRIEKVDIEEALIPVQARRSDEILHRPLGKGLNIEALVDQVVRHYLDRVWKQAGGNKTQAAKLMGLDRQTFTNWMKKYGIEEDTPLSP